MTPGEMYTVTPHAMHDGVTRGGWHCQVLSDELNGRVIVREMQVDGGTWRPRMSTAVPVAALAPLAVQVDLFGNPTPLPSRRRAA